MTGFPELRVHEVGVQPTAASKNAPTYDYIIIGGMCLHLTHKSSVGTASHRRHFRICTRVTTERGPACLGPRPREGTSRGLVDVPRPPSRREPAEQGVPWSNVAIFASEKRRQSAAAHDARGGSRWQHSHQRCSIHARCVIPVSPRWRLAAYNIDRHAGRLQPLGGARKQGMGIQGPGVVLRQVGEHSHPLPVEVQREDWCEFLSSA